MKDFSFNCLNYKDDRWWATCWSYRREVDYKLNPEVQLPPVRARFKIQIQPFYALEFKHVNPFFCFWFATKYGTEEEYCRDV